MKAANPSEIYNNWNELLELAARWKEHTMARAFAEDSNRAARFSVSAAGLCLDYSKNHIDENSIKALLEVADKADLKSAIKKLLRGEHVNNTEDRPALHTALRFSGEPKTAEQKSVQETLDKMTRLINS